MKRIVLIGPESTGKSTLCKQLATHYNCTRYEEIARDYLTQRNGHYDFYDLEKIAKIQIQNRTHSDINDSYAFYDTEMLSLKIWSDYRFDKTAPFILNQIKRQHYDTYLLCYPDLVWQDDPLRENENDRHELFEIFVKEMQSYNLNFEIIKGKGLERFENALRIINTLS